MKLYDRKDVQIVANVINEVGPNSDLWRAKLVVEAALAAGIDSVTLEGAIDWVIGERHEVR